MKKIFIFFCIFFTFFSCESKKTSKEMYQYDLSKGRKNVEDNSYSSSYKNGTIWFLGEGPFIVEGADIKTFKAYTKSFRIGEVDYDAEDDFNYYYQGNVVKKESYF